MKYLKMVTAVVCMTVTTISFAQEKKKEKPSLEKVFKKLDGNEDGQLDKEELGEARNSEKLLENFDQIDTDKDGLLNLEEFKSMPKPKRKE